MSIRFVFKASNSELLLFDAIVKIFPVELKASSFVKSSGIKSTFPISNIVHRRCTQMAKATNLLHDFNQLVWTNTECVWSARTEYSLVMEKCCMNCMTLSQNPFFN